MASYHFAVQIIRRSQGRSAIAAAAYRAGVRLVDEQNGRVADYRRRRGVEHTEILLPEGAALWLADRQKLWCHATRMETRVDAQLAREVLLALPHELTPDQRRKLVLDFAQEAFVRRGMVADVALHRPGTDDPRNFHAHILLTLREAHARGLRRTKTRAFNSRELLGQWRSGWAHHVNRALERAGSSARVDHRTLLDQHIDARRRGDHAGAIILDRAPEVRLGLREYKTLRARTIQTSQSGPARRAIPTRRPSIEFEGRRTMRNAALMKRDLAHVAGAAARWRRRAVRFRTRQQAFQARLHPLRGRLSPRPKRPHPIGRQAMARLLSQMSRRIAHAKHRSRQLERLTSEAERVVRRLLGRQAQQLLRRSNFLAKRRPHARRVSRGRARRRTFLSIAAPGNT